MAKKSTVKTFVRVKLHSKTGAISFKDLPIEGKYATEEVVEMHLIELEEVETIVQKVVIGGKPTLTVVE